MENMKYLPFAKAVEVTSIAKDFDSDYKCYHSLFICRDTHDYHIIRITKDINSDFQTEIGTWLFEYEDIPHEWKYKKYPFDNPYSKSSVVNEICMVLQDDVDNGLENMDYEECDSYEECLELVDGGFSAYMENEVDGQKTWVQYGYTEDGFTEIIK